MATQFKQKYIIMRHLGRARTSPEDRLEAGIRLDEDELNHAETESLQRDADVLSMAPAMPVKLHEPVERDLPGESDSSDVWGLSAVGAAESAYNGANAIVAVLDTGIDRDHPAFAGTEIIEQDFSGEGNGDRDGHGTHCCGTIFGKDVGETRIGIAPGIERALIGKVLGEEGGSSDAIVRAINWALDEGAHVISMSLGIDFPGYVKYLIQTGMSEEAATSIGLEAYRANINIYGALANYIKQRGLMFQPTLVVAASGNESMRPRWEVAVAPPAASDGIYAVGALGQGSNGLETAYFSNGNVDISAPGVSILSAAAGGGLTQMSGTSMATPHVAGVAALWTDALSQQNALMPGALNARLIGNARFAPLAPGYDPLDVGTGIVQAP